MTKRIQSPLLRERFAEARAAWNAGDKILATERAAGVFIVEGRDVFGPNDKPLFDAMIARLKPPAGYRSWEAYFANPPPDDEEEPDTQKDIVDRIEKERGRTRLHDAAESGNLAALEKMLNDGADPNAVFKNGKLNWTPLAGAVFYDHEAVVKRLLAAGARVEGGGITPVIWGVQSLAVAKLILAHSPDLDAKDDLGRDVIARVIDVDGPKDLVAYLKKAAKR